MSKWQKNTWIGFALRSASLICLLMIAMMWLSYYPIQWDMTEEQRHTISPATREQLHRLREPLYVEIYLGGELPAGFRRLRKRLEEMLKIMSKEAPSGLSLRFIDPMQESDPRQQRQYILSLEAKGIQPTNLSYKEKDRHIERLIFPGLLLSYQGREVGLMLLKGSRGSDPEAILNQSIEGLEYQLLNGIRKLLDPSDRALGILRGYDRIDEQTIKSLHHHLRSEGYEPRETYLSSTQNELKGLPLLLIIKPERRLSKDALYQIDQYLMNGGRLMIFLDGAQVNMDKVSEAGTVALSQPTGLEDLLFHYGLRLEPKLVCDLYAAKYPIITGRIGNQPQMRLLNWPFFPVIHQKSDHPITRNLEALLFRYASPLDTVKADGIRKTPLLHSSPRTRLLSTPTPVALNQLKSPPPEELYRSGSKNLAYLLEGSFRSAFRHRPKPQGSPFRSQSPPTQVLVVGDGDLILGMPHPRSGEIMDIGMYLPENMLYGNKDFLFQALDYCFDPSGAILTRNRQVILRPLDHQRLSQERAFWQILNLLLPLLAIATLGLAKWIWRRKQYT